MSEPDLDEMGPVDYLVVEFPEGESNFTGEMAAALVALVDTGTIRLLDLLIIQKSADGSIEALEIDDLEGVDELRALEAEIAEILAEEDVAASGRGDGAGQRGRCPRVGERVGGPVRLGGPPRRRAAHRQWTHPHPSHRRLHRGRTERRSLRCHCDQHEPCDEVSSAPLSPAPPPLSAPPRWSPTVWADDVTVEMTDVMGTTAAMTAGTIGMTAADRGSGATTGFLHGGGHQEPARKDSCSSFGDVPDQRTSNV